MGMRTRMREDSMRFDEQTLEALNEKSARSDRLREKWARVPEIGSGIKAMSDTKGRNLAVMLEKQARYMAKMTEATYSSAFAATPENMIRLVRLAYPNSIRDKLFTEFNKAVA